LTKESVQSYTADNTKPGGVRALIKTDRTVVRKTKRDKRACAKRDDLTVAKVELFPFEV